MAQTAEKSDVDLPALARQFLGEDGDVRAATTAFAAYARSNRKVRDTLTEPLIEDACYNLIRRQVRSERRAIWLTPNYDEKQNAEGALVHAARSLMDFRLPIEGNPRLADASRDEIAAAVGFYETQAKDMAFKARWLTLVGQHVPAEKTVGDVLNDDRLRELQREATDD